MGKVWVEVCLISARGLQRSSSLWKLQWFAVGWIDPNNKYCTKIDASGNANPVWRTKFSTVVDQSETNYQDLELHVEVYSREPIFLRERLQGTATILLKEFLAKYKTNSEVSKPGTEEVGSFQLRRRNSAKPQGFVDISIHISEEREGQNSHQGVHGNEGFQLMGSNSGITLATKDGPAQAYPPQLPVAPVRRPDSHPQTNFPYAHPMPFPTNYSNPSVGGPSYLSAGGPSHHRPQTPPPPPPPSNVGYIPTFLPRTDRLSETYVNMPSSGAAPGRSTGPGFGMGVGAGALAAGAVIFGDDFMSGFDFPAGLQDASLTISTDPPF
ncbi:hypothetical protein L1049_012223 [Liquidambar formosana]|uniref:C2 domain-containing protein n=1 Tax=Liquidambar formosana TaxID=63359 RepID=A0AAP0RSN1_LIQFO